MGRGLLWCSLMALAISCSTIEEDRMGCPCMYRIDFSKVDTQIGNLYLWFFDSKGKPLLMDTLASSEYGDIYEVGLKRGTVGFYVWGNVLENTLLENQFTSDPFLRKGGGFRADPLYSYRKSLDTAGEDGSDVVIVRKEYADLGIILKGGAGQECGFVVRLDCGTSGRYVDGRFLEEDVSLFAPLAEGDGSCSASFRLMRQKSLRELRMSICREDDLEFCVLDDFPVGELALASGYDMEADDLQDITVVADISAGTVVLRTEDWETVIYVDVRL